MKTKDSPVKGPRPRASAVERLKPERVQDGLAARQAVQKAKESLAGLPGWELAADSRSIGRVRTFADHREAAAYAAFAAQLAGGRRQPLRIGLSAGRVAITLYSRGNGGNTGMLLDLAAELG
jgi:pterin-4a-carbinolamine dehydratase